MKRFRNIKVLLLLNIRIFIPFFCVSKVTVKYDYIIRDTNLTEGTNDQAGQDAYYQEKVKANQTRTDIYNSLGNVDWGEFQSSSGLELKDKNVDNFNLGEVEAYCSEKGAVVRKCDEADLNCGQESCKCTKDEGNVTKCSKYKYIIKVAYKALIACAGKRNKLC